MELDVRPLRKPDKHPTVFAAYAELAVGASFVLINDHDPRHLHDEFETEHAGGYGWEYRSRESRDWRIEITKLASTPLPQILADTTELGAGAGAVDATGAVWKLPVRERDLDANVIALPPDGLIDTHAGPDLDVLLHVIDGSGQLTTERSVLQLRPGGVVWLPRRSRRRFDAGPDGLRYLTVHRRRQALLLDTSRVEAGPAA